MTMEERIETLERANRRHRLLLGVGGLAVVAGVCISAAQDNTVPDVIRARRIEVTDGKGIVLVALRPGPERIGTIVTFDNKGFPLVALGGIRVGDGHLGMVATYDGKGQQLVALGVSKGRAGAVATFNSDGQKVVELGPTDAGNGTVATYNFRGEMLVGLGATDGGSTGAVVIHRGDRKLVTINSSEKGGNIVVLNNAGQVVAGLGVDENGDGFAQVRSRYGSTKSLTPES